MIGQQRNPRLVTNAEREGSMKRTEWRARARRVAIGATAITLVAGTALAQGNGGAVAAEGEVGWTLSSVYHILAAHFPVGLWVTAYLFILIRSFSDSEFAVRVQRAIWPVVALGTLAGFVTYGLGLTIYPWSAITESPLGRNHILLATWTLSYWTVMSVLGYRFRRHLFDGAQRWITLALATIGMLVITITGTLGGSLTGTPSLVTKSLNWIGWNVYMTFYLPTWMLLVFAAGAVLLVVIGIVGHRAQAGPK